MMAVELKQIFILFEHKGNYMQIFIFEGQHVEKLVKIPQVFMQLSSSFGYNRERGLLLVHPDYTVIL